MVGEMAAGEVPAGMFVLTRRIDFGTVVEDDFVFFRAGGSAGARASRTPEERDASVAESSVASSVDPDVFSSSSSHVVSEHLSRCFSKAASVRKTPSQLQHMIDSDGGGGGGGVC